MGLVDLIFGLWWWWTRVRKGLPLEWYQHVNKTDPHKWNIYPYLPTLSCPVLSCPVLRVLCRVLLMTRFFIDLCSAHQGTASHHAVLLLARQALILSSPRTSARRCACASRSAGASSSPCSSRCRWQDLCCSRVREDAVGLTSPVD
jgi:hypothetical protein